MFRFALKCLCSDKNEKDNYQNEMFKLLKILHPPVYSAYIQSNYFSVSHFKK